MKIGYFADGPWSHKALEKIVSDNDFQLAFIVPRYDTQDPVLKQWSQRLKVPYLVYENVNSTDFIDTINQYGADVFVSMSFNQILRKDILSVPSEGFINCHAGALPFYRGRNPLNWVLINDEKEYGITVHYIDEGIDTGDIIRQNLYPIGDKDSYATLLSKAVNNCAEVLYQALKDIHQKKIQLIKQYTIHPVGTYFTQRVKGDENISFEWSARFFFNFVRAITLPGPGARCKIGNQEYAIVSCLEIENAPVYLSTTGAVVGRSNKGITIKVADSTILITEMAEVNSDKVGDVFIPSFPIGARLSSFL
ncbi:MAG: methionyl-tRNA formyltransferase [Cellvibrionaceae bacterium]